MAMGGLEGGGWCASAQQELALRTQGCDWTRDPLSPAWFGPGAVSPAARGPAALSLPSATLLPCPGRPAPAAPRAPGSIREQKAARSWSLRRQGQPEPMLARFQPAGGMRG